MPAGNTVDLACGAPQMAVMFSAGIVGYASYAPAKAAVRSLADVLRNEVSVTSLAEYPRWDHSRHLNNIFYQQEARALTV